MSRRDAAAPPRVLHLVWDLMRGGTEGQCARVAIELSRRGLPQRVAAFRRRGFFLPAVEAACGPVYEIGITRLVAWDTLRRVAALRGFIRREEFDVVHGWDMDACLFGSVAARWAGVPFLASRRNLAQAMPRYKRCLLRRVDRRAAAVVVNARAVEEFVLRSGVPAARMVRIPNLLDLEEFDRLAARPAPGPLPTGRLIGMVARLDPEKDAGLLVRAFGELAAALPDTALVLAGEGSQRAALEAEVARQPWGGRVRFLGEVTDVPALLRRLEVAALVPAANEGLSNSILEYMAAGLPVVATDCGGNRELLEPTGAGWVVARGDAAALAAALRRLLEQPGEARAMGRRGRAQVAAEHAPAAVADRFAALYARAAAGNS